MGRTLTLTNAANSFTQGLSAANIEIILNTLGGNDLVTLNRVDDLGGGCTIATGTGADTVVNLKEMGNVIRLGLGNDTYVGRGFGSFASDPIDQIFAGDGNDLIAVETFHSRYSGEAGNDRFFSVGWQNSFFGGSGIDSISYAPRDDDFTQGGSGVTINLAQGFAQTGGSRREVLSSIENATGSGANDALIGSAGANRLDGGGGFDDLTGGGGADRFVFAARADCVISDGNFDLIFDFHRAEADRIDLALIDANTRAGASGNQAFSFIAAAGFDGHAGQLRFQVLADGVLVTGDINGDRVADFGFGVLGVTGLTAADFLL